MIVNTSETTAFGEMPPGGYTAAALVLIFIGVFGFFLNLFVIYAMYKEVKVGLDH